MGSLRWYIRAITSAVASLARGPAQTLARFTGMTRVITNTMVTTENKTTNSRIILLKMKLTRPCFNSVFIIQSLLINFLDNRIL